MHIDISNTQFFTFFSGMSNGELLHLERLVHSFRRYNKSILYVLDQHLPLQELVRSGSRIHLTTSSYAENVTSDLDEARLERLFEQNADILRRIQIDKQYPHGPFIDEALYHHRDFPYAVIMDSDVVFLGDGFLDEINAIVRGMTDEDVVAAGHIVQRTPFELPSQYAGAGAKHFLHRFGDWLVQRYGLWIYHGQFPRFDPAFLWINGDLFTRLGMSFFNLRLNVFDTTLYGGANYKLLGDNGASVLFQAAAAGKTVINIDIRHHVRHEGRGARALGPSETTGPTFSRTIIDWAAIARPEWPPVAGIGVPTSPLRPGARKPSGRLVHRVKQLLGPLWRIYRSGKPRSGRRK